MALAVLSIDLEARLAKLDEGMTRAQRLVERSGAQMERAFVGAAKAATSLVAIVGGVGFGALARSVLNGVDALNDFADATGTSVENASALEDIAARTGTSMDSAAGAVVRFNKELAETAKKDSEAARIFEKLGLNAAELRALDPAEALLKTAQALQGVASDGDKARLVQQLFGKSVREVAPFLKDLAEAGALNATVTSEQAKAAEDFNKAIFSLQKDIFDLARGAMQPLLEALTQVGGAFKSADQYADELTGSAAALAVPIQALTVLGANVAFVFKGVGTEIGAISAQAAALLRGDMAAVRSIRAEALQDAATARANLDQFERRVLNIDGKANAALRRAEDRGFIPQTGRRVGALGDVGKPSQAVTDALARIGGTDEKKIARIRAELEALIGIKQRGGNVPDGAFASLADDLAKLDPAARAAADAFKAYQEAREKAAEMAAKADAEASKAAESLLAGNESLRDEIELIGKSADERARLEQARIANIIAGKEEALIGLQNAGASEAQISALQREIELLKQRRSLVGIRAAAEKNNENIPDLAGSAGKASDAARELGLTFSSAFEDAIVNGERFSDVLKGIEKDLIRLVLRKAVTEPLANSIAGLFGGGGTTTSGKDSAGINYGGWVGAFASLFSGGYAKGGYIPPGQFGLVGERGMEFVSGGRSGKTITPMGRTNNVTINMQGGGGSRFSQQQQAEIVGRAVSLAVSRNG